MSSEKKSGLISPNLLSLLLILLGGGLFVSQNPFHDPRPDSALKASTNKTGEVHARLWQDPFDAISRQRTQTILWQGSNPLSTNNPFLTRTEIPKKPIVMAVMLPGGEYAEDSEARRRIRYAVLSGLMADDGQDSYYPEDSEHLHYLDYQPTVPDKGHTKTTIAFEMLKPHFSNSANQERILILYLKSEDFHYTALQNLANDLNNTFKASGIDSSKPSDLTIKVLGPATSDELKEFVVSAKNANSTGLKLYSPRATVDEAKLLTQDGTPPDLATYFKQHGQSFIRTTATDKQLAERMADELAERGVIIGPPPKYLNWPPATKLLPGKHVVLISEKESLYAQHIGATFADALRHKRWPDDSNPCSDGSKDCYVDHYQYFRGLDGKLAKSAGSTDNTDSPKSNATNDEKSPSKKSLEHADGNSQYDYMRRLADEIAEYGNELAANGESIAAIGVLGSDVYDKLLVLEALHEKIPDTWFFTNGLDARLLHPEENEWARNLIVVSSYGLSLPRSLQNGIPRFRDSVQTAYFFSTLLMRYELGNPEINQVELDKQIFKEASLHEIGRHQAFELSLPTKNENTAKTTLSSSIQVPKDKRTTSLEQLNPLEKWQQSEAKRQKHGEERQKSNAFIDSCLYLFTSLLALWGMRKYFYLENQIAQSPDKAQQDKLSEKQLIWGFGVFVALATMVTHVYHWQYDAYVVLGLGLLFGLWHYFSVKVKIANSEKLNTQKALLLQQCKWIFRVISFLIISMMIVLHPMKIKNLEPFAFMEGVSMWPSEGIRTIAFLLALHWSMEALKFPKLIWERLNHQGRFTGSMEKPLPPLDRALDIRLTERLAFKNIAILATGALGVSLAIILGLGPMFTPYRGVFIFVIDSVLLKFLLVPTFLFLTVGVTECARAVIQTIRMAGTDQLGAWPSVVLNKYKSTLKIPSAYLNEWVTIRIVGDITQQVSRLISYPLYIAALMILARMSYFDKWNTPPGLMIVIGLAFGYLFYCDYRLKTVADAAEKNAIKNLRRSVIAQQGNTADPSLATKLAQLTDLAERYAEDTYKPFLQRPIFQGLLVIVIATAIGYTDYLQIMISLLTSR